MGGGETEGERRWRDTEYPVFEILEISNFQFYGKKNITKSALRYCDRNRGNQHNSNIAAEAMTRQTPTVPRWSVLSHKTQRSHVTKSNLLLP